MKNRLLLSALAVLSLAHLLAPARAAAQNLVLSNPGSQPAGATVTVAAPAWTQVGRLALAASTGTVTLDSIGVVNGAAVPQASGADLQLNLVNAAGTGIYSTGRWDGAKWVFGAIVDPTTGLPLAIGTTPVTFLVYATAAWGAAAAETFAMQVSPANVVGLAPATATTGTAFTGSTFTTAAPATVDEGSTTNTTAPLVSIVNPEKGELVSGAFLVQIYVFSPGGAAVSALGLTTDGTTPACATNDATITKDAHAYAAAGTAMYGKLVSGLSVGTHVLKACARNAGGTLVSAPVTVSVRAAGAGDGNMLVRDDSSQLCTDCHDRSRIVPHSSEASSKYGTWSTTCRDCHTPHGTRNLYLVKEQIVPPAVNGYQPAKSAYLATTAGDSNVAGAAKPANSSFVNTDNTGPCQVCHTRTSSGTGAARWRNTGNADAHYTSAAGTQACTNCHSHKGGFVAAESGGGAACSSCHAPAWGAVTGATPGISSRHGMGSVVGTNDSATDSGLGWSGVTTLSQNAAASRSCVNMCHDDHVHDGVGGTSHDYDVFTDATTATTRAMTRSAGNVTAGSPARTDFVAGTAPYGLCASCHQKAVDASRPAVSGTAFAASAHSTTMTSDGTNTYAWRFQLHDGSTFDRNCTKCHASRAEGGSPTASGSGLSAVHGTQDPSLLAGNTNPASAGNTPASYVCYDCHGNGTTGANRSGRDLASVAASAFGHPVNSDAVHSTASEATATAGNGAFSGAKRHVNCIDCHDSHQAQAIASGTRTGTATFTAGTPATLVDPAKAWTPYQWSGYSVRILANGTAAANGQTSAVYSNGANTLYVSFATAPTGTVTYEIIARGLPGPLSPAPGSTAQAAPLASGSPALTGAWGVVPAFAAPVTPPTWGTGSASCGSTTSCPENTAQFAGVSSWAKTTAAAPAEGYVCAKCHSSFAYGAAPPSSPSGMGTSSTSAWSNTVGAAVVESDLVNELNPANLAHHAVFARGQNQPIRANYGVAALTSVHNPNWPWYATSVTTDTVTVSGGAAVLGGAARLPATAMPGWFLYASTTADAPPTAPTAGSATAGFLEIVSITDATHFAVRTENGTGGWNTAPSVAGTQFWAITAGLGNAFVPPFGPWSVLDCSDCHKSGATSDPLGPHGSSTKWMLRNGEPQAFVGNTGASFALATVSYTPSTYVLCLNCHRRDVYGDNAIVPATTGPGLYSRQQHPPDSSDQSSMSKLPTWGIACMNCHGGAAVGAIHGSNLGLASGKTTSTGYSGKRLLAGAAWYGVLRSSTAAGGKCWAGADSAVNQCSHTHSGTSFQSGAAKYDYESGVAGQP